MTNYLIDYFTTKKHKADCIARDREDLNTSLGMYALPLISAVTYAIASMDYLHPQAAADTLAAPVLAVMSGLSAVATFVTGKWLVGSIQDARAAEKIPIQKVQKIKRVKKVLADKTLDEIVTSREMVAA
jgi:hypothetical protein